MRKNNGVRTHLKNLYYAKFKVSGLNLDRLLNRFNKREIKVFNAVKKEREMFFLVKAADEKKVFAICNELCYTVLKVKNCGKFYPLAKLYKSFGVALGLIFFITFSFLFNGVCTAIEFSGTGSVYEREVREYLTANGVREYTAFSSIDLEVLENNLLSYSDKFSFVSCEKIGNRLKINLVLANGKTGVQNGDITELRSDTDGVIEEIKVYRGTATVGVGDSVKKGDLLVGGYSIIKEEYVPINVLASVSIIAEKTFVISLDKEGRETEAIILAKEALGERETVSEKATCKKINERYEYTVKLYLRKVLVAG